MSAGQCSVAKSESGKLQDTCLRVVSTKKNESVTKLSNHQHEADDDKSYDDNDFRMMSRAGNEATEEVVRSSVRIAVAFPPKNLHIHVSPEHPKVGVEATLTCQAGLANPPPKLTWFIAGQQVPHPHPPLMKAETCKGRPVHWSAAR